MSSLKPWQDYPVCVVLVMDMIQVTYSPLLPLALLLFSGLYLFVLPNATGSRGGRQHVGA